jgi:hypothetical protein
LAASAPRVGADSPATAPVLPVKLQPYVNLAAQCAKYQELVVGASWRVVYSEDFSGKGKPTWSCPEAEQAVANMQPPPPENPYLRLTKDEDRTVLYFQAHNEQGLLAIGPKVSGDFAVQITAKAISDRPCDLSIVTDRVDAGPAFQFGAHYNTQNKLWVGPVKQNNAEEGAEPAERWIQLPAEVLIQKNVWHHVRLEVRDGHVLASVDGRLLGKGRLSDGYDALRPRQPMVYCYSSAIELKAASIETVAPGAKKVAPDQAWAQVFGDEPRDAVAGKVRILVDLLGDDDESVRNAAQGLLRQVGDMAVGPLESAAAEGLPEQKARAQELLRLLRPLPQTQPSPPPRAIDPPPEPNGPADQNHQ